MTIQFLSSKLKSTEQKEVVGCLHMFLLIAVFAGPAFSQDLHFGLKVGVPVTNYFEPISPSYSSATRRYTAGPSVEMRFGNIFGFELDVLYKRIGYVGSVFRSFRATGNTISETFDVKGNSWDFPLLVKYWFGQHLQLYVAGGGILRYIGPVQARGVRTETRLVGVDGRPVRMTFTTPIDTPDPFDLRKRTWPGLTVAGGLEFERGRLRLLPEFRYTRLTANINERYGTLRFNPNQAEFLLGILF